MLLSLRCCNIGSSLFAMVMTQVALLSATGTENTYMYNATTGVIASILVICLGFFVIGKSAYMEKRKQTEDETKKVGNNNEESENLNDLTKISEESENQMKNEKNKKDEN